MYNNSHNQLNQNQHYQINQNLFIQNINQNFRYPNQQQNYNLNNIIQLNPNQYNNQTKIQNFQIPNTNQNQIIYQNNPQNQILNNNIQFINNNNNLNNINYNNIPFSFQNNINQNIQNNNNKQILINNQFAINNNIRKEVDLGYGKGVPEDIIDKLYNSIVNIKFKNDLNATGFFMKIKIKEKEMKCLFTCQHVISEDDINNKITINIYYGKKDKEDYRQIKLDKNIRYMRVFNEEDVTLIEIIENDKISENKYLDVDLNYKHGYNKYKGRNFYLAGYPKDYDGRRCISAGIIKNTLDYKFSHTLFTNFGSSGSPICNENGDVIGIHTSGDVMKMVM